MAKDLMTTKGVDLEVARLEKSTVENLSYKKPRINLELMPESVREEHCKPMGVKTNTSILVENKPGEERLYAGTAMYEADIFNLGTITSPDVESIVPLVDELDVVMLDENGIVIME